jgi:hypothetical protein
MNTDRSHKTLEYMIRHFENIKFMSMSTFITTLNELSDMANGGDFNGNRSTMYPCEHHTDQFFVELLQALGFDSSGLPLDT